MTKDVLEDNNKTNKILHVIWAPKKSIKSISMEVLGYLDKLVETAEGK